jgi:resuscitation-promoting factor RpfA
MIDSEPGPDVVVRLHGGSMAQRVSTSTTTTHQDRRTGPRLTALLGLSGATGLGAILLALRVLDLVGDLPVARVETYLEIALVGIGCLLAAWIALTSTLGAACVAGRTAGRRWAAGERIVQRHAPAVVRRLTSVGVALSVGAGLALGAGSAHAAPPEPAPPATPPAVDLGWRSTTPHGIEPLPAPTEATEPDASVAPSTTQRPQALSDLHSDTPTHGAPAPARSSDSTAPAPAPAAPAGPARSSSLGTDTPTPPAAHAPRTSPGHEADGAAPVAPASSPSTAPEAGGASGPRHVPLGTLVGGTAPPAPPEAAGSMPVTESSASSVSVVVLRGDSLWKLAERALGPGASDQQVATESRRWYEANIDVIGADPDVLLPGQVLQVPRSP